MSAKSEGYVYTIRRSRHPPTFLTSLKDHWIFDIHLGLERSTWSSKVYGRGIRVREEQRRTFNQQEEQGQRAGLSCSVGSPTDPFYIRPRLSPHFVSVEAAVEVPRYTLVPHDTSNVFLTVWTIENRVMWDIVFSEK